MSDSANNAQSLNPAAAVDNSGRGTSALLSTVQVLVGLGNLSALRNIDVSI